MDAVELVRDNMDGRKILDYYGFEHIFETSYQIRACCKIHNGNNKTAFVWNKQNNLWYCYTGSCGGGDGFDLVMQIENCSFPDAVKRLAYIFGLSIDLGDLKSRPQEDKIAKENKSWVKSFNKNFDVEIEEYSLPDAKYYSHSDRFNRFDDSIIRYYNATFCDEFPLKYGTIRDRMIVPIIKDYNIVGVACRDLTGQVMPKWYFAPKGIKVGNLLYNIDNAKRAISNKELREIILVEGIFDVWAFHRAGIDNVVAIFGASVSEGQKREIIKLGCDVITSFDGDDGGRKATASAKKTLGPYCKIRTMNYPEGKDPADVSSDYLWTEYLRCKGFDFGCEVKVI